MGDGLRRKATVAMNSVQQMIAGRGRLEALALPRLVVDTANASFMSHVVRNEGRAFGVCNQITRFLRVWCRNYNHRLSRARIGTPPEPMPACHAGFMKILKDKN